jgi:hypothetical protein
MALPVQQRTPDLRPVDPGEQSTGAGTNTRQRPQQDASAAAARDIAALRQETSERDLPTGPPPAFEVSLLEMESDLKHVLARVEAARAKARDAEALRAAAASDEARATDEAKGLTENIETSRAARAGTGEAQAAPVAGEETAPSAAPARMAANAA